MIGDAALSLSDDARTTVLLCSSLAAARGETIRPLGPVGFARLLAALEERGLTPGALLAAGSSGPGDVARVVEGLELGIAAEDVGRLLARSGHLGFELERLAGRGIRILTLADTGYPWRLRDRLGRQAPPVLFVAGDASLLDAGGVAIVGSRDVDAAGSSWAAALAECAARDGVAVVSGGARGVDQTAMSAAFTGGGRVLGLLPEGIERRIRERETRAALADGLVVLASPYHPGAGFTAGAAMARNKLIYALSDLAVVVASAAGSGGTWAGAVEALRGGWVPVFARSVGVSGASAGLAALMTQGALPLEDPEVPFVPVAPTAYPEASPRPMAAVREEPAAPIQQTLDLL